MSALGFGAAAVAVFCFGTNFIPVKQYDTGDGMFFQWCMCAGIWTSGLMVQFIRNSPPFEPLAVLGGVLWCTGNITAVPIIQCVGLGLGMLIWSGAGLLVGWACGFFGMLGEQSEQVNIVWLNIVGVMLALTSMGTMFFIRPGAITDGDVAEKNGDLLLKNDSEQGRASVQAEVAAEVDGAGPGVVVVPSSSWVDALSPIQRRMVGITGALIAGCFYGTNFNPPQYLKEHRLEYDPPKSDLLLDYVFSHFTGIFLTSTLYFIIYILFMKNKPFISSEIALPSYLSGLVWSFAQISWFIANNELLPVIAFPIITSGPGILASIIGVVFFAEIQGQRNFILLGTAICITLSGVICIALSKLLTA